MADKRSAESFAHPRLAAGALSFDERDRVLLVRPCYKPHWDIPGGYVEVGESPRQACVREVEEELGIGPRVEPLLAVDWAPHPSERDKLLFVFDGGVLERGDRERIRLDPRELTDYAFHDLHAARCGP